MEAKAILETFVKSPVYDGNMYALDSLIEVSRSSLNEVYHVVKGTRAS